MGLPFFEEVWHSELVPFLQRAAGGTGNVVLLAHNEAALDEIVLKKEIARLQLDVSWCPRLICADPVVAVKQNYYHPAVAAEYRGRHRSLTLADMHQRYVSKTNRIFKAHNLCALNIRFRFADIPLIMHWMTAICSSRCFAMRRMWQMHICNMIGLQVPDLASMGGS